MVSDDGYKHDAAPGAPIDQLLEEYLRVINDKDDQLHRLLRQLEDQQAAARLSSDTNAARIRELTQQLHRREGKVKELQGRCTHGEELNTKLVNHVESLKVQLQDSEATTSQLVEDTTRMSNRIRDLEDDTAALRTTVASLEAERDATAAALERTQQQLSSEAEAASALRAEGRALTLALEERQARVEHLEAHIATLMPRSEHDAAVAALEKAAAGTQAEHRQSAERFHQQLQQHEAELQGARQALTAAQRRAAELAETLQSTSAALTTTRAELVAKTAAAQGTEKELRDDVSRRRVAQQELSERVGELERAHTRTQDALQRTAAEMQHAQVQHERHKAAADAALEAAQTQLRALQEELRRCRDEAAAARRHAEVKERAAADGAETAARLREHVARAEAEAREKTAAAAAALAAKRDECEHLQGEVKRAQAALLDAQRRTADDEHALSLKLEELTVGVHRLQTQLRDKEEDARRLVAEHEAAVQRLKHDFATAAAEVRTRHEAEVRDVRAHLDTLRAELGERTGGTKGLERELQRLEDARRDVRGEVDRLHGAVAGREEALQYSRREAERLQAEVASLTQRLTTHETELAATRQRLAAAERVQLDWKATAERAETSAAAFKRAADDAAAAAAALQTELTKKDGVIAAVRREAEAAAETRQAAVAEAGQHKSHREAAVLRVAAAEERLATCEAELRAAAQEHKKLQRAIEEGQAELRRANVEVSQRDAECARLARHAEDVEALARRTSDELTRNLESRDDTIRQLRSEQAAVVAQLNEEKGRHLVLQERLQRQQEASSRGVETAEERVRAVEEERAALERDVAALQREKAALGQQVGEAAAQAASLSATLEGREQRYQQRKEEVAKALAQVEEVKAATAATLQEAEAQSAAAAALKDKYKKEKSKMGALLQRMEEKMRDSAKREKGSRQREAGVTAQLAEVEAALRRLQDSVDSRVSETKSHYDGLCRQQAESAKDAAHDAAAAAAQAHTLQAQLLEAQRRATAAEASSREGRRHLAAYCIVAAEEYAEEAVEQQRAYQETILRVHRTLLSQAACCVREGWAAAQRTIAASSSAVQDREHHIARVEAQHRDALHAVEEAHARQLEAAAAEHQEEVARLQREMDASLRRATAQSDVLRRTDGDRDGRCRLLEDAVERLKALLEMEKKQTAALRDRIASEELRGGEEAPAAQEELRRLQRAHDKLLRQLEDKAVEQKHNEDELREQRAEVAALQSVLDEKEREYRQEADRAVKAAQRAAAAVAAREATAKQCEELQAQVDFTRGQLESARASHQRVLNEQQATQRTRDARLEATQAELATVAAEKRRLQAELVSQEQRASELVKELQALRRQEADLLGQLQARKSEISALRERCANLESLKNISDATLAETQSRERDLTDKIEELRNAQQLMQLCFDKQQEQLEIGRRLRQQDAQLRPRYSP